MGKCNYIFHTALYQFPGPGFQGLGNGIHTSNRGDDPDLIADSRLAVRPAVSVKVNMFRWTYIGAVRRIIIGKDISQGSPHIVDMDPAAFLYIFLGISDAETILDDFILKNRRGSLE